MDRIVGLWLFLDEVDNNVFDDGANDCDDGAYPANPSRESLHRIDHKTRPSGNLILVFDPITEPQLCPCHFTGLSTATTIKSQSSSNRALRSFMPVYELASLSWIKASSPNATSLIANGEYPRRWWDAGCRKRKRRGCWLNSSKGSCS